MSYPSSQITFLFLIRFSSAPSETKQTTLSLLVAMNINPTDQISEADLLLVVKAIDNYLDEHWKRVAISRVATTTSTLSVWSRYAKWILKDLVLMTENHYVGHDLSDISAICDLYVSVANNRYPSYEEWQKAEENLFTLGLPEAVGWTARHAVMVFTDSSIARAHHVDGMTHEACQAAAHYARLAYIWSKSREMSQSLGARFRAWGIATVEILSNWAAENLELPPWSRSAAIEQEAYKAACILHGQRLLLYLQLFQPPVGDTEAGLQEQVLADETRLAIYCDYLEERGDRVVEWLRQIEI